MNDVTDLSGTIIPKSDQLNSEQLLAGSLTITVTAVKRGATEEQPLTIHYQGDNGRPYKPCKTMRKLLVLAWGKDGTAWTGRSMTLYCDPKVQFGGSAVGGTRISHMSHIDAKGITANLTATRGKKATHTVKLLEMAKPVVLTDVLAQIEAANSKAEMEAAKKQADLLQSDDDYQAAGAAYGARVKALRGRSTPSSTLSQPDDSPLPFAAVMDMINKSTTPEALGMAAGFIEGVPADQQDELRAAVEAHKLNAAKGA